MRHDWLLAALVLAFLFGGVFQGVFLVFCAGAFLFMVFGEQHWVFAGGWWLASFITVLTAYALV